VINSEPVRSLYTNIRRVNQSTMKITLIGMSGTGKSYWASRFSESGFNTIDCDRLIALKLKGFLLQDDGSFMDMGRWMGFPYESGYESKEAKYLECEKEVFHELVERLESEKRQSEDDLVLDTGGSLIYMGEEIITRLKRLTIMVHLSSPEQIRAGMLESYMACPRPVLWMGMFKKRERESNTEALKRCYPLLLSSREKRYEHYADISLDYYCRTKKDFDTSRFLLLLNKHLYKKADHTQGR